jgi:GNAT superfamily N-acetyltransferase
MMTLTIATAADAAEVTRLAHDTFTETFGHLYPPEDLAGFLAKLTPQVFESFIRDPAQRIWLARENGGAVGFAHAGLCSLPHPDVTPACGELKRLYVRKGRQRGGLGSTLLTAALTWLDAPGRRLWIGVWSENHGAQRLYGRRGFHKVGEYDFPVGGTRDREFILRRG